MIEINLSTSGKDKDITNFGGINLSLLNVRYVFMGVALIYTVGPIINLIYDGEIQVYQNKAKSIQEEERKKTKELRNYDSIKKQVKELEEQERRLKSKVNIVKEIVDMRQNPFSVLVYIAENTPKNVWLIELELEGNRLKLLGYSTSWKSIGDFIENLKSSIFFNGSVSYNKPDGLDAKIDKKRVESFEITTQIVGF